MCISERQKPAVGQQCRAAQSLYVRDGVTAVADWMSPDVYQHLHGVVKLESTDMYTSLHRECYRTL